MIGKGPLVVVDGTMDAQKYVEILQSELIPEVNFVREEQLDFLCWNMRLVPSFFFQFEDPV